MLRHPWRLWDVAPYHVGLFTCAQSEWRKAMLGGVEASPRGRSGCSLGDVRHGVRGILPRASLAAGLGLVAALVAFLVASMATSAVAADRIRIVAQKTGTLAWEL